jgi:3-oxoacyl-[acyl-carrier-protein] synthase II
MTMKSAGTKSSDYVLVGGLGPVTCLGCGLDALVEGATAPSVIGPAGDQAEPAPRQPRLVPEFDLQELIATRRPYLDPQSRCALAAAALALRNAEVELASFDPDRCGLAYASMLGNLETLAHFQRMVEEKGMRLGSPVLFSHAYPNTTNSLLSIEFGLRGHNQNFCGDALCGAQALECAVLALRRGAADLVLAGGADVVGPDLLGRLGARLAPGGPAAGQGAAMLVLEAQRSAEERDGYAFCELASVVCLGAAQATTASGLAERLWAAVRQAMQEADAWEGDIGVVFVAGGEAFRPLARAAEQQVLREFSQVPVASGKRFTGETFAAGFPLECILAADVLNEGVLPPRVTLEGTRRGVEVWVEREPEGLMGDSALVIGCSPSLAAAAVLRAL